MKKVDIYTSDTCPQCVKAKEYLKENGIEYTEHNISRSPEARRELIGMGYMSIPVMVVGEEHILGFDLNRMKNVLEK